MSFWSITKVLNLKVQLWDKTMVEIVIKRSENDLTIALDEYMTNSGKLSLIAFLICLKHAKIADYGTGMFKIEMLLDQLVPCRSILNSIINSNNTTLHSQLF